MYHENDGAVRDKQLLAREGVCGLYGVSPRDRGLYGVSPPRIVHLRMIVIRPLVLRWLFEW